MKKEIEKKEKEKEKGKEEKRKKGKKKILRACDACGAGRGAVRYPGEQSPAHGQHDVRREHRQGRQHLNHAACI